MDNNTTAAKAFYREVRRLCANARPWTSGIVFIDTTPSDRMDISKISERIYGTRHEVLAVMAAAGMNTMNQPLEQQRIAVPTKERLMMLKRQTGFESVPELRRDGEPIWVGY